MRDNRVLRQEAWNLLRPKWFWRLLTVSLVLNLICNGVSVLLSGAFNHYNIQTLSGFLEAKLRAAQAGLYYTFPSWRAAGQMAGASLFQMFIAYIFAAILAFGLANAALKAAYNDDEGWFGESFGGFRRPLEVAWLMALMNLRVFLWSLLLLFPGLIAAYRYRQAWYLKSQHPDWTAAACLSASGRLMRGYKWRAFCFDCSYLGWAFLAWVAIGVAAVLNLVGAESSILSVGAAFVGCVAIYLLLFVIVYFLTGRAVFYKELCAEESVSS